MTRRRQRAITRGKESAQRVAEILDQLPGAKPLDKILDHKIQRSLVLQHVTI